MLIVTNAFVFQSVLAGKPELATGDVPQSDVVLDNAKRLRYEQVIAGWDIILNSKLPPDFPCCQRLIEAIATDDELVDRVLAILCDTAKELVDQRLTQVHELAGTVSNALLLIESMSISELHAP